MGQDTRSGALPVVWPVDGATDVPISNGAEAPDPPGQGFGVSLHCHNRATLIPSRFVLTVADTGAVVATLPLNRDNDPTQLLNMYGCFQALMPVQLLTAGVHHPVPDSPHRAKENEHAPQPLTASPLRPAGAPSPPRTARRVRRSADRGRLRRPWAAASD